MKIPYLFALLAALITGVTSLTNNANMNQTCIRMIIAMVVFYLVGVFVSYTLTNIVEEQNRQKIEAENKIKEEELEKLKAERLMQELHLGTNLDLVEDSKIDDGFSPLDLSQAVRTKINE